MLGMFLRSNRYILDRQVVFKHFRELQILAFMIFQYIRFFMTMRHSLLLAAPIYFQKEWWALKNLQMGFSFFVAKLATGPRNFPCLKCWQYAVQIAKTGYKGKHLLNFAKTRQGSLKKSCFTEKSSDILGCRPKMDATTLQGNLGWLTSCFCHFYWSESCFLYTSCLLR